MKDHMGNPRLKEIDFTQPCYIEVRSTIKSELLHLESGIEGLKLEKEGGIPTESHRSIYYIGRNKVC
jgi:hypothetical protein